MKDETKSKKQLIDELVHIRQRIAELEVIEEERIHTEEALKESETKYRTLTDNVNVGVYRNTVGPKGKFIEANPAIVEMFGYETKEEFLAAQVADLYQDPDDRKTFNEKMLQDGFVADEELQLKKKDGALFIGSVSAVAVKDEKGRIEYYDGIIEDITERKKIEEALLESEQKYRDLFENAPIGIYRTTPDGHILMVNPAVVRMLGYDSFEELAQRNLEEEGFEPEYPRSQFKELMEREGQVIGLESTWVRKDGTTVCIRENAKAIRDDSGTIVYEGTVEDITERKKAEEALRESETKYRTLADNINVGVYRNTVGPKGKFIEANPAIVEMFGYETKEEFLAAQVADLYQNPDDRKTFNEKMLQDGFVANEELQLKKKDGAPFIGSVSAVAVKDEQGRTTHYDGIIEDITERKKAEEALQESEEKYRTIIKSIEDGYFEVDIAGNITFFNDSLCRILGYPRDELINMNNREYMDEENATKVYQTFNAVFRTGSPTKAFDWEIIRKDGTKRFIEASVSLIRDFQGEPTGFRGIVRDITERKQAAEALHRREEEFRLTFENAKDAIFWADPETGLIIKCNKAAEILLEKKREEIIGHHQTEIHPPEKADYYAEMFRKHIEQKGALDEEGEAITKSGVVKPVHITASITVVGGNPIMQGIFRDITERKQAEQELKESEERYRTLVELAPDGIITLNMEGVVTSCNTSALEKTGYSPEEMVGKHFSKLKFLRKEDIPSYVKLFNSVVQGEVPETFEAALYDNNGTPYVAEIRMELLKRGRKMTGTLVMARDITERKRTEKQLKSLFEASRLINSTMDIQEIFTFISDSVQELVGFDHFMIFLVSEERAHIHRVYAVGEIKYKTKGLVLNYGEGLVGSCVKTKETVLLKNAHKDRRVKKIPGVTEPFVSQIVVPLVVEDKSVGALHISKTVENAYDQQDVDVLKPLSEVISSAIRNSRLYDEITAFGEELEKRIEERSKRIEIILSTRQKLQRETSWEKGLTTIAESIVKLGFDRSGIALVNVLRKTLDFQFGRGVDLPEKGMSVSLNDTRYYGVKCVQEKRTLYVREYNPEEGKQITSESTSFIWVPIIVQDEAFAALGADNVESKKLITEEDVKDLEILAGMCAVFIDRTRTLVEPVAENRLKTEFKHWLDPAECYIVMEKKPEKSLEIFVDLVTHGIPGFLVSRMYPEKIKRMYKLARTPMLWLSQSEMETVLNPSDLSKLNYIIEDFTRKSEESVILLDGVEYLVTQVGFDTVIKCVEELKDIVTMNNSRLIIPLHEGTLSERECSILEKGFIIL